MRALVIAVLLIAAAVPALSQIETTAYFMTTLPQVVDANPAFVPKHGFAIGLPFSRFGTSYSNNGFSYNDLTRVENGKRILDLPRWQAGLPEKTFVTNSFQMDMFRLGLRLGPKFYLSFNTTARAYTQAMIPKDVATLLVGGNAAYVGKTANLSPTFNGIGFAESSLGLSVAPTDKLRVGARVKALYGGVSAMTELSDISLSVADNYAITVAADLHVKTSGLQNPEPSVSNYMRNSGWAADFGATYKILPKLTVAASIVDLGYIKWNNDLVDYKMDKASANFTFSGLDINELMTGEPEDFDQQLDSLAENFKLDEVAGVAFNTPLPSKFFVSGSYDITKSFSVGTVFFAEQFMGRTATGWTASLNKNFGRVLGTGLSYTVSNRSGNNLGAGLSVNLGPVQVYAVGDNLLRLPISLAKTGYANQYINSTQVFNARLGVNFVWGWKKQAAPEPEDNTESYNQKKSGKTKEVKEDNSKSFNAKKTGGMKATTDKKKQPQPKKKKVPSHIKARQRAKR